MLKLVRLVALGAGLLMVLGARADVFSDAQSTLICSVQHFGVSSKMSNARGDVYWESGSGQDADALLITIQPNFRERAARVTFVSSLPPEAKALFLAAAKGQRVDEQQSESIRLAVAEHSTQILVAIGSDDSLQWAGEMYGQQLNISCLPK